MLDNLLMLAYLMGEPEGNPRVSAFEVQSPAFADNQLMPKQFTCAGQNISPPLAWEGAPKNTQSYAIVMVDEDRPYNRGYVWSVFNIPAYVTSLPAAFKPQQTEQIAANSWGQKKYSGLCPMASEHHYRIFVYALDTKLNANNQLDSVQLRHLVRDHLLASSEITGIIKSDRTALDDHKSA